MDGAKKLAYLLEGCGAKYTRTIVIAGTLFTVSTGDGQYFVLVRNDDAGIEMWSRYFTPEQAIAATLGTEPDEQDMLKLHDRMNAALLDMQEELLAYHPQDRENASSKKLIDCVIAAHQIIEDAATVGAGTCVYTPDETGFTWWDENDVEHYEEHSASDECCFASCDKCGNQMMVGDDGWFNGWDEITEWWEEDGSYHKGYVLEPRFKYCPNCGRRIVEEEAE